MLKNNYFIKRKKKFILFFYFFFINLNKEFNTSKFNGTWTEENDKNSTILIIMIPTINFMFICNFSIESCYLYTEKWLNYTHLYKNVRLF